VKKIVTKIKTYFYKPPILVPRKKQTIPTVKKNSKFALPTPKILQKPRILNQ